MSRASPWPRSGELSKAVMVGFMGGLRVTDVHAWWRFDYARCAGYAQRERLMRCQPAWTVWGRQPRRAASIAATSIFVISIMASNARLATAGSGSVTAAIRTRGVICHD